MKGKLVDTWYVDSYEPRRSRRGIYSPHRKFLYEVIHRSLTQHNIAECCWALKLLPRMTNIDPFVIFRFIMIMIHTSGDDNVNKNFLIYLEALLSRLELAKPDLFAEFLTYFISNNRVEDARDLFTQRHRYMSYLYHREIPLININIGCYDFLFNYLDWRERLPNKNVIAFDVSIQGWLVNAMNHLKQAKTNHELFVICVANVLLFYGFRKKAYLFLGEFQRNNPDNISAQLLLFNLIKSFDQGTPKRKRLDPSAHLSVISSEEEKARESKRENDLGAINNFSAEECDAAFELKRYPIISDNKNMFDNLCRLDPRREEVLELSAAFSDRLKALQLIMDSLEYISEIRQASRWRCLQDILNQILASQDESLIEGARTLWQTRYHQHWSLADFLVLAAEYPECKVKHRKVIKSVLRTLTKEFNPTVDTAVDGEEDECEEEVWAKDEYYDLDCLDDEEQSPPPV